jgi:hypothetical protein
MFEESSFSDVRSREASATMEVVAGLLALTPDNFSDFNHC